MAYPRIPYSWHANTKGIDGVGADFAHDGGGEAGLGGAGAAGGKDGRV